MKADEAVATHLGTSLDTCLLLDCLVKANPEVFEQLTSSLIILMVLKV